jgi:hypothetical protein
MGSGVALAEKMAVGVYFGASLLNSKEQKAIWNPMAGVSVCYLGPDSTAISACLSINRQRSMVLLEYHLSARIRLRDELRWYSQVVIQNLYRLDWRTGLELLLPGKSIMLGYRNKSSTLSAGLGINRGIQIYLCLSYHSSLGISPVLSFLDAL